MGLGGGERERRSRGRRSDLHRHWKRFLIVLIRCYVPSPWVNDYHIYPSIFVPLAPPIPNFESG